MPKGDTSIEKYQLCLAIILVLLPIVIFSIIYLLNGPYWDVIAHYLDGRTLVNLLGGKANPISVLSGEHGNNLNFYFEAYRAPISYLVFALLVPIFGSPMLPYFIILYLCLLVAVLQLSKELKLENCLLIVLFLGPSIFLYWFMGNGEEIVSIIFAIFGIIYLIKDRPISGAFFALSAMGKFPALILLPMVLLLATRKKTVKALSYEILVIAPLLIFSFVLYGNPVAVFLLSFSASSASQITTIVYGSSVMYIAGYTLLVSLVAVAVAFLIEKKSIKRLDLKPNLKNRTEKILAVLLVLSFIDFLFTGLYHDAFTQTRYGYMLTFSLIIIAAYKLSPVVKKKENLKLVLLAFGVLALVLVSLNTYLSLNNKAVYYYNPDNPSSVYANASSTLSRLGYENCRVVSNDWVPFLYAGVNAYSPFASSEYNKTAVVDNISDYPIVIFRNIGVSSALISNLDSSKIVYNNSDFAVFVPRNVACYTN